MKATFRGGVHPAHGSKAQTQGLATRSFVSDTVRIIMNMNNIPNLKCGILSVSRDCFIISLSENRRHAIAEAYAKKYGSLYEVTKTVENERDMLAAVKEAKDAGCNAMASQVEMAGKITLILLSMPILMGVIDLVVTIVEG